mgnify:CR=1 FL=1
MAHARRIRGFVDIRFLREIVDADGFVHHYNPPVETREEALKRTADSPIDPDGKWRYFNHKVGCLCEFCAESVRLYGKEPVSK